MNLTRDKAIKILLHILIWSLLTFIMFMYPPFASKGSKLPADFVIKQIVHMSLMLAAYYVNSYTLVPQLLFKGKNLQFGLSILIFVCIAALFMNQVDRWLDLPTKMQHLRTKTMWSNPYLDMFALWTTLFTLGISTSISVSNKWDKDSKKLLDFQKEQIKTELLSLKAQIHPHFFFNTLNSIYALSYVDVEASRKVLTQLSRMMRYLLYETQQNETTVERELVFIKDYVNIMKLRLNDNTTIDFVFPETVKPMSIAPMILMPYIENTFKHGVGDEIDGKISICIVQNKDGIVLTTKNKIVPKSNLIGEEHVLGIGMQNTHRRLDLLYADRYQLSTIINEKSKEFELKLVLDLHEA